MPIPEGVFATTEIFGAAANLPSPRAMTLMMLDSIAKPAATLIIIAEGPLGRRVADTAQQCASYDPECRGVLRPGDAAYPARDLLKYWTRFGAAALVVDIGGRVCALLDAFQATSPAWIEDAFLRGRRGIALQRAS